MKNLAQYLLGNFSIFPKGGRSSTTEVPDLFECSKMEVEIVDENVFEKEQSSF